jgi:hypothetical protein
MWPKYITQWIVNSTLYISVPFTWLLPLTRHIANTPSFLWSTVIVGGPATKLMPGYFDGLSNVHIGDRMPGVLQRVNPNATRTTEGCIRKCGFCGVSKIEPAYLELEDWPDLPILCDNNILAASEKHFDKVCDRLEKHGHCDFNQGIDARLLTDYHAERLRRIGESTIRLSLDNPAMRDPFENAYIVLRRAKFPKRLIRSYVLCGFNDTPELAWEQCEFVESHGVKALPMWFHPLDAMKQNQVSEEQGKNGWTDYERRRIMQWFYWHKEAPSMALAGKQIATAAGTNGLK